MARNHQEWVRYKRAKMKETGARNDDEAPAEARWDYAVNKPVIDQFFRDGIERAKGTEDLITIGMRGDGDTGLGGKEGFDHLTQNLDDYNKKLLENIISNQRRIIAEVTGKKADKTPQMWALYKEVQRGDRQEGRQDASDVGTLQGGAAPLRPGPRCARRCAHHALRRQLG